MFFIVCIVFLDIASRSLLFVLACWLFVVCCMLLVVCVCCLL